MSITIRRDCILVTRLKNQEFKGIILGVVAVTIFGLTLPATRFVIPYLDATFIALGRASVAAVLAALLLFVTKQPFPTGPQIKALALVALGVVIGFPLLSAWAMQSLPASHGGVVLGILPLATAAAGRLVSDERPSTGFWLLGLLGSILVVAYSLIEGGGHVALGDIALLGAVISAAFGYAVGGKLAKEMGSWQVISWALVLSFPFIIIPTISDLPEPISALPFNVVMAFLYLAIMSQFIGFFVWYKAMAIGGIARVSQTQLLQPFITIVVSSLLLSEHINLTTLVFAGTVVMIVGIGKRMPIRSKNS
jgi:drug/metabolite transporter (DMT)-like permease